MEQIFKNFADPSWWFTGIFFALVAILLAKLFSTWGSILWRETANLIPEYNRRVTRWKEKIILKKIKNYRQHEVKVHWLTSRYWAMVTVSTSYFIFVIIMYALSPNIYEGDKNKFVPIALFIPAYAFQLLSLWEKIIVKRVIESHVKWKKRIPK